MSEGEGRKDDTSKIKMELIPPIPLRLLGERYTVGSFKYGDYNWAEGMAWGRVYGAAMRHLTAWWSGERDDPEDKGHHLAAACFGLFTLMEYERLHPGLDDRPKRMKEGLKYDANE